MEFPYYRPRRLRKNKVLLDMCREATLSVDDLIMPLFIKEGTGIRMPIPSMPGQYQLSIDCLTPEVAEIASLGIPAVLLFGIPTQKDSRGTGSYQGNGVIQQAIRAVKKAVPRLVVISDVCLCEYTDHGHCGIVKRAGDHQVIDNDATLEVLQKMALSHAEAGVDMVAPSDMMDGRVKAIRETLDTHDFSHIPIMAYSAKYCSSLYSPFRDAAESPPQFGDRSSYQMDIGNAEEALREVALDIAEGADIVMVKPALGCQDIIYRVKSEFGYPLACYNVSGEFSMVKAAAEKGWLDEQKVVRELLFGFKRAGADLIITYFAKDVARWLKEERKVKTKGQKPKIKNPAPYF